MSIRIIQRGIPATDSINRQVSMTNIVSFPDQSRIQEAASHWLVRLDGGPLSEEEVATFSEWLGSCPQNREAIVELCRLWDHMEVLSELATLFSYDHKVSSQPERPSLTVNRPAFLYTVAAASVLVIIVFLHQQLGLSGIGDTTSHQSEMAYQTLIGEKQDILLEDGSIANLNTDSHIVVYFSDRQRNIRLIRGEVYFDVAHYPDRPFLVHAGSGIVRAVGTAFSVRLKGQNMEVTVTEGKVEVTSAVADTTGRLDDLIDIISDEYLATLSVGQTAEFGEKAINMVQAIEPEAVSRKLSWQHGMLEFNGETLAEVVGEISRYTDKKIIISDASIRDIRIGGYFKTGEVDALLAVLKDGFPITINRVDDNLIYLSEGVSVQPIITN